MNHDIDWIKKLVFGQKKKYKKSNKTNRQFLTKFQLIFSEPRNRSTSNFTLDFLAPKLTFDTNMNSVLPISYPKEKSTF